jgi:hypothetical protein
MIYEIIREVLSIYTFSRRAQPFFGLLRLLGCPTNLALSISIEAELAAASRLVSSRIAWLQPRCRTNPGLQERSRLVTTYSTAGPSKEGTVPSCGTRVRNTVLCCPLIGDMAMQSNSCSKREQIEISSINGWIYQHMLAKMEAYCRLVMLTFCCSLFE